MAYLCRVGRNPANVSGIEARGYRIFRRGTTVRVVWGPISIERQLLLSIVWCRKTMFTDYSNDTVRDARTRYRELLGERLNEGYFVLPAGSRILPLRFAVGVTERP